MKSFMTQADRVWLEDTYEKLKAKISAVSGRVGDTIPYVAHNGKYTDDMNSIDIAWWTNGFWAGMLWQMYHATGEKRYMEQARVTERLLDRALDEFENLYHDVGFMWMHSAVADYRLTGDKRAYARGMHAANILAGRFNPAGGFIRAWNGELAGWMIIDCLMNLSILYWASEESKDPRFTAVARLHAAAAMEKILRPDGSSNHIVILDPENGQVQSRPGGQGFGEGSSWSRGQAWAVYGMAISYAHTRDEQYLTAAKQLAHYFIANLAVQDWLPLCDFRAPDQPVLYDSTAGACAVCGLLEIAKHVPEHEQALYYRSALRTLRAMEEKFCCWDEEKDGILYYGKVAYHEQEDNPGTSIIYGDYFFTEAILRLMEKDMWIW